MKVCYYLCDQAMTRKSKGIWLYTKELISTLAGRNLIDISALSSLDGPQLPGVENVVLPIKTGSIPMRLLVDNLHPGALPKADIYHYPKGFMPFIGSRRAPCVASILDTIVFHYYDNYRNNNNNVFKPFELEYWLAILTRTLKQTKAVITISHKSAAFIEQFCEMRAIRVPPVFVTYLASKFQGIPEGDTNLKQDYVVHFASELPHKRTAWLLDTWNRALMSGRDLPELRLVGKLSPSFQQQAESTGGVKTLPYLDDQQLKQVVMGARALIYPSEIEGFGLPALEAYQLGTPALYVADTSVDEIMMLHGENAPGRFQLDPDDFWRAFDDTMNVPLKDISIIQKELCLKFSWDKTAEQTVEAYRKVLSL